MSRTERGLRHNRVLQKELQRGTSSPACPPVVNNHLPRRVQVKLEARENLPSGQAAEAV